MSLSRTLSSDIVTIEIGGIAIELTWSAFPITWDLSHNIAEISYFCLNFYKQW